MGVLRSRLGIGVTTVSPAGYTPLAGAVIAQSVLTVEMLRRRPQGVAQARGFVSRGRTLHRVLKRSHTIAHLAGSDVIKVTHLVAAYSGTGESCAPKVVRHHAHSKR
jgi:hypothetical protein